MTPAVRRTGRAFFGVVALVVLVCSIGLTALRFVNPDHGPGLLLVALASYAVVGYVVALVVLLALLSGTRNRYASVISTGLGLSLLGLFVHVFWLGPLFFATSGLPRATASNTLVVMTLNTNDGHADVEEMMNVARARHPDVLVLEGVSAAFMIRADAAGLERRFPYHVGVPRLGDLGTMVFAGHPFKDTRRVAIGKVGYQTTMTGAHPLTIIGVHASRPTEPKWAHDMGVLRTTAAAALGKRPVLVVGDFNATLDNHDFRDIENVGLGDAADDAGSGWQPTWPSVRLFGRCAALVAIDHVLSSHQYAALSTSTYAVTGSTHRILVATLVRR